MARALPLAVEADPPRQVAELVTDVDGRLPAMTASEARRLAGRLLAAAAEVDPPPAAGPPPYGWTRAAGYVPDVAELDVVEQIGTLHADGLGAQAIASELNRRGIPSRYGRPWAVSTVRRILGRPGFRHAA